MDIPKHQIKIIVSYMVPYFQGLYISRFALISKFKDAIFMNFYDGQCMCNIFEVFQGFVFHEFSLYHKILEILIP